MTYAAVLTVAWVVAGLLAWAMVRQPKPWRIHYTDKRTGERYIQGHYTSRGEALEAIKELSPALPGYVLEPTTQRNA